MLRGKVGMVRLLRKRRRMVIREMEITLTRMLRRHNHQLKTNVVIWEKVDGDGLLCGGFGL